MMMTRMMTMMMVMMMMIGDDDDVNIRYYASAYSSPICTPNYDNNVDASSSSNYSTVGDSIGVRNNNEYEVNDDDAKDANHDDSNNDANGGHDPFSYFPSSDWPKGTLFRNAFSLGPLEGPLSLCDNGGFGFIFVSEKILFMCSCMPRAQFPHLTTQ